ncbi:hypothetical protein [uncultured Aliiroseovarius sp.]|uniref:hypothetical protein n=1 Tax=uncultured Aliiroseovarius sp. TaxID=1658783 RepID=UPI00261852AC|nr:hypothetical protein [uncultured Aliiroseovarius sp.]
MSDLIKDIDPRGLIKDSYLIDGIRIEECRSIFLDWALFDDHAMPQSERIALLLDHYETAQPAHPMTTVLRDARQELPQPKRRGGRKGRVDQA